MLEIRKFTVEGMTEGCVTDRKAPRFSWQLESDRNGCRMASAHLKVGGWEKDCEGQISIPYAGSPLQPFTEYETHLSVTDDAGETAEAAVSFETGRLDTPWSGKWISDGQYHFTEKAASPKPMVFRKKLPAFREVKKARIYATAMGIYDLYLDGEKVGRDFLAPGFTAYQKQLQYQTYDVTDVLADGREHELTAVVAGGWAVGRYTYKNRNRVYANRQALLAEVKVDDSLGQETVIGTDQTWEVTMDGPFLEAEFYNGEVYDARKAFFAAADDKNSESSAAGRHQAGNVSGSAADRAREKSASDRITTDTAEGSEGTSGAQGILTGWHAASLETLRVSPKIEAQYGDPVRAHEVFHPVSVTKAPSGALVYDFGQNFAGVICAKVHGAIAGQKIVFTHAEVLMNGELYREPLRTAKQEAVLICRDGDQTYMPTLTYMGFRYVGVTGISEKDLELTAVALYSDIHETGSFSCSNELLNKLQSNICWGAKSNFVDIPTDCPQRDERLGWTGDIALFSPAAVYNFSMKRFLEKWLRDVKAEQRHGGGIPMIVPFVKVYWQWELVVTMAVDHWGDVCVLMPWAEYQTDGDLDLLREMYPVMQKYVKACKFWAGLFSVGKKRYIWQLLHHYGDWVAPNSDMWTWMKRGKFTATAALSRSSAILAQIADLLEKPEDSAKYRTLHEKTADAYRSVLMDENCRLKNKEEFQTGYVLPLHYDMLNEADRKKTAARLHELVKKEGYHIGTGFPGTPYILFALADNGYEDDAFKMLLCDTCPSWLYEVKVGGTTIWERWDALKEDGTCNTGEGDGTGGMVSFNHYASGAVGDFLYRRIAGIEATSGGYRTFRVKPLIGGGLTSASGSTETAFGKASSSWSVENGAVRIKVSVPVGSECELVLPDGTTEKLESGTYERTCRID